MEISQTLYVFTRDEWRKWLESNFHKQIEIWLIFPKKSSGKPRISYNDAVEEALSFGWIDSTVKNLDEQFVLDLPKDKIILFLDLASNSLEQIEDRELKDVFIIDHHEISQKIPKGVYIINPELNNKQKISSSSLTYLFCKELAQNN